MNMDKTIKIRAVPDEAFPGNAAEGLAQELTRQSAQLEEEKKRAIESAKKIEQLRGMLQKEQARTAELEAQVTVAETKVKDLTDALDRISSIAATMIQVSKR
jgi:chromosome segregation ATPase